MKQLIIVRKDATVGECTPLVPDEMGLGSVGVYALNDPSAWLTEAATSNVAIVHAIDGTNNDDQRAFIIPEVDVYTLRATYIKGVAAVGFSASITVPANPAAGKDYTLVLVKKGTVLNERYQYTATEFIPTGSTVSAANLAGSLRNQLKDKLAEMCPTMAVGGSGTTISVTDNGAECGWALIPGDGLSGVSVTVSHEYSPGIGDKKYMKHLASVCAAGKGVNYTDLEGRDLYPKYPTDIPESLYNLIHLRFAVGRDSAKQRDERVWQEVYIAVPASDSAGTMDTLLTIFGINTNAEAGKVTTSPVINLNPGFGDRTPRETVDNG